MSLAGYIARRFLALIPVLIFLPLLTFVLMHLVPGNYFDSLRMNPEISPETVRHYEAMYHLDQPVLIQYGYWLRNILRLDFGYSFAYKQPVLTLLLSRTGNTLLLTSVAFLLAWVFAVVLGLLAGVRPGTFADRGLTFLAYLGLSVPGFFLCLLLLWAAVVSGILPFGGIRSVYHEDLSWLGKIADVARHMVIPVFALSYGSFAYLFRLMRSETLGVLRKDFVFYLRALRIPRRRLVLGHIARNAINPLITILGLEIPQLFSGAALIEIFTGWPGLGQMMLQAVRAQDLFLVLGNMLVISVLLVAGNLLADILLAVADPRIRLGDRRS